MRDNGTNILVLILAALVFGMVTLSEAQAKEPTVVIVRGSNAMANPVGDLAKSFMKANPGVAIVVSGGGTPGGIAALLKGQAEIAMASETVSTQDRETATKKGLELEETIVGWSGIAVIINPENSIGELSIEQVQKLFSGEYQVWSKVGGPETLTIVYTPELDHHGTALFFQRTVMKTARFSASANPRGGFAQLVGLASVIPESIAFVPLLHALEGQKAGKIKIVGIKKDDQSPAIQATPQTAADRSYPLACPLMFYYDKKAKEIVHQFVKYCVENGVSPK